MRFESGGTTGRQAPSLPLEPVRTSTSGTGRRSGRLRLAAVRPDYDLTTMNGARLQTPGHDRPAAANSISAVSYRAELEPSAWEVVKHVVDPTASVIPRVRVTGGASAAAVEAGGLIQSAWSMDSAIAAAAALLGRPVSESGTGALVEGVRFEASPLRLGDVIVAVDGERVTTAVELRALLAGRERAELEVRRDSSAEDIRIRRAGDGSWGLRVITAGRSLQHGLAAEFTLPDDLRGPSLGLACALSVVDAYTGGSLAAGGAVVATGTVDLAGRIGGVGALRYKAQAVRAHPLVRRFLVPAEHASDVEVARRVLDGRAEVVAVRTLSEAVGVLQGT